METKERTHTPLPWAITVPKKEPFGWWIHAGDVLVCSCGTRPLSDEALANAAFIVRACNSHDDLLAACEAALTRLRTIERDKGIHSHETIPELEAAIARARS